MNGTTTWVFVLPVRLPSAESLGFYGSLKRAAGVHGGLSRLSKEGRSQIALYGSRAGASRWPRFSWRRKCRPILIFLLLVFSPIVAAQKPCQFTAGRGPEMVVLPGGEFMMGSPENEIGREEDEGPLHKVLIQAFAMARCEVTVAEFRYFVNATGYVTEAEKPIEAEKQSSELGEITEDSEVATAPPSQKNYPITVAIFNSCLGKNWRSPGFQQSEQSPVTCVSWHDAKAYIRWLSKQTGVEYRLPSEAEWEYAARAGTETPFSTGKCISAEQANFYDKKEAAYGECPSSETYLERTAPVASYAANSFGLYDMHGNLWEWVEDCYFANYEAAPDDGSAWQAGVGEKCADRVLRGGSWFGIPVLLRSAARNWDTPDERFGALGFRLARTL